MPGSGSERATARALVPVSRTIVDPNSTEGGADGPDVSQWGRDARRARALHDRGRAAGRRAAYRAAVPVLLDPRRVPRPLPGRRGRPADPRRAVRRADGPAERAAGHR